MNQPKTYYNVKNATKRFIIEQGSTRSGKTYSILQFLIELCWSHPNSGMVIDIIRDTMPALRGSAMKDFFEILKNQNYYDSKYHNKTHNTYNLFGNEIAFYGANEEQKVRGRQRDIAYLNEGNELKAEVFNQINWRTKYRVIIDYNPSFLEHEWIDPLIDRTSDTQFNITTYNDNPFLIDFQKKEIEILKDTNKKLWQVYGLGQRAVIDGLIYPDWQSYSVEPEGLEYIYGLDFGFTAPMGLIKIGMKENNIYLEELFYNTNHTTQELIEWMNLHKISKVRDMYCDTAEKDRRQELVNAGFHALPSVKDVSAGISHLRSCKIYIHENSVNLRKEIKSYQWKKDMNDKWIDGEPVKFRDHLLDGLRYGKYTHYLRFRDIRERKISAHPVHNIEYDTYAVRQFLY